MGLMAKPSDYFRKAVQDYLDKMPRGGQKQLAEKAGLTPRHLNDFLGNRRAMTEEDQLKITKHLGVDYLEFLQRGKDLTTWKDTSQDLTPTTVITLEDKELFNITKRFKQKARAIQINEKLVYAEQLDEDALYKIERQIDLELEDLEKRAGKKRKQTANGNE